MPNRKIIRVSSSTPVNSLAGSIVISVEDKDDVELRAIGASAVNQMFKAVAVSRGTLAPKGKDILIKAGFETSSEDAERTVMVARLVVID